MKTYLLDRAAWDFVLDTNNNFAIASDPYSIAQDICSAVRTFIGEVWYDTTDGVPYFQQILGRFPSLEFLKTQFVRAALTVPQVLTASCTISQYQNRNVVGEVAFTYSSTAVSSIDEDGSTPPIFSGIVSFLGDNTQLVTFIGDNALPLSFYGED